MNKVKQISPLEHSFLQRVSVIDKPAKHIYFIGDIPELWSNRPIVAIVGSRKPTDYGKAVTLKLASDLAAKGVIIVSGLALGHDALAAQGALDAGGTTIAIVGNGLNKIYPASNSSLADRIVKNGGAIISEYAPDYPIYKHNFLERNRLIAALSDIVIIVEANERSGTLNTAAHALAQNKELMVVPGNITSPLSVGCNRLLAQGAAPVLGSEDVIEKLQQIHSSRGNKTLFIDEPPQKNSSLSLVGNNETETKILQAIASGVCDGDEIIRKIDLTASEYSIAVTMLEIAGKIKPLGANRWILN